MTYPYSIWRTGDAVAFEALLSLSAVLGEAKWGTWVAGALKVWSARALPFQESDDTAAGRAMCMTIESEGDHTLLERAMELGRYLMSRRQIEGACVFREVAPLRSPFGDVALGAKDAQLLLDPGPCILMNWLQMPLGFLAYLGEVTTQPQIVDFAADQALAQLRLLQDDDGLLWHVWLEKTRRRYGLGWGRGQAWSLLGLLDLLEYLPRDHSRFSQIAESTRRLASAIASRQLSDGGWPAVLVDEASPVETSTACFAVAAFKKGMRLGVLAESYVEPTQRAWAHALSRWRDDGVLTGVSGNIGASTVQQHYSNAPLDVVVPWGQGPLLLAAISMGALADGQ